MMSAVGDGAATTSLLLQNLLAGSGSLPLGRGIPQRNGGNAGTRARMLKDELQKFARPFGSNARVSVSGCREERGDAESVASISCLMWHIGGKGRETAPIPHHIKGHVTVCIQGTGWSFVAAK